MISVAMMLGHKNSKLPDVVRIDPDATALTAADLMMKYKIGSLMVMKDSAILGIVTERDLVWKLDVVGKSAATTRVREIWTCCDDLHTVSPEHDLEECLNIMVKENIRHLPVVDGEGEYAKVIGVISIKDILKEIADHQIASDHIHGSGFPRS